MIKRIIFDIDNTLLDTNKDCIDAYQEYINLYKLKIEPKDIYNAIGEYEEKGGNFNKGELAEFLSKKLKLKFSLEDLDNLLKIYAKHGTLLNNNLPEILDYLRKKYELVTLTNWYDGDQLLRLTKAGIAKYFKEIYGFKYGMKPSKEVFIKACGGEVIENCLMIGDSIKSDIKVSQELGMQVLYYDSSNYRSSYPKIKSLDELKEKL